MGCVAQVVLHRKGVGFVPQINGDVVICVILVVFHIQVGIACLGNDALVDLLTRRNIVVPFDGRRGLQGICQRSVVFLQLNGVDLVIAVQLGIGRSIADLHGKGDRIGTLGQLRHAAQGKGIGGAILACGHRQPRGAGNRGTFHNLARHGAVGIQSIHQRQQSGVAVIAVRTGDIHFLIQGELHREVHHMLAILIIRRPRCFAQRITSFHLQGEGFASRLEHDLAVVGLVLHIQLAVEADAAVVQNGIA